MKQYLDLLRQIQTFGEIREDRTGTGTISLFGPQYTVDLRAGFPLLTTKRVFWKGVVLELLWFLKGDTNINYLKKNGVNIWNEWATESGEIGPLYGAQWVRWGEHEFNQIHDLIENIRSRPHSRRHLVSAWNVDFLPDESRSPLQNVEEGRMALAPCHVMFQFYVHADSEGLSCKMYQRSQDVFLGGPFNLASYALLTHMVAQQCDLTPRYLTITLGDAHVYLNHLHPVNEQLERTPRALPTLNIVRRPVDIFSYEYHDFELVNYNPHPKISASISV